MTTQEKVSKIWETKETLEKLLEQEVKLFVSNDGVWYITGHFPFLGESSHAAPTSTT